MAGPPQNYGTSGGRLEIPISDVVQTSDLEIDESAATQRIKELEDTVKTLEEENGWLKEKMSDEQELTAVGVD